MKTAFARALAFISLATTLSGFAVAEKPKSNSTATVSAVQQQSGCAGTQEEKHHKKQNKNQNRSEQEQEFDRILMGIFG